MTCPAAVLTLDIAIFSYFIEMFLLFQVCLNSNYFFAKLVIWHVNLAFEFWGNWGVTNFVLQVCVRG